MLTGDHMFDRVGDSSADDVDDAGFFGKNDSSGLCLSGFHLSTGWAITSDNERDSDMILVNGGMKFNG